MEYYVSVNEVQANQTEEVVQALEEQTPARTLRLERKSRLLPKSHGLLTGKKLETWSTH